MRNFLRSAGVLLVAALFLAGCSKSSSTGTSGTAPQLKAPTFSGPTSTSSTADTSAGYLYASSYAAVFTAYSAAFMGYFVGTGTQSGNSWTWTYTADGITGKWVASSSSSGYSWSLSLNGSNNSSSYNNWTAISGNETSDGTSGNWTMYYENSTTKEYDIVWSTSSSGVLTGTITQYDSTGTAETKDIITNNKDKSGELKEYAGTALVMDVIWNADGSGHYTEWDDQGNVVATGTWS